MDFSKDGYFTSPTNCMTTSWLVVQEKDESRTARYSCTQ